MAGRIRGIRAIASAERRLSRFCVAISRVALRRSGSGSADFRIRVDFAWAVRTHREDRISTSAAPGAADGAERASSAATCAAVPEEPGRGPRFRRSAESATNYRRKETIRCAGPHGRAAIGSRAEARCRVGTLAVFGGVVAVTQISSDEERDAPDPHSVYRLCAPSPGAPADRGQHHPHLAERPVGA